MGTRELLNAQLQTATNRYAVVIVPETTNNAAQKMTDITVALE
jgi:hypothetical protein|tara:strand:- start:407 stop:535 length:129 start_codon:yes stop_codon:yes gene_type:complete